MPFKLADISPNAFVEVETATFQRTESGAYWQTEPREFCPDNALCTLADEVAELKSQRLRLCRGIHMFMMDGVDPSVAYGLLRAPEFKDVRWWDFGPEDDS